ncbi:MAG: 23S rRNA (uracil(1939)-C(5))-methyltransferase RlmD [Gammaproteobacteria bacterium]|nr:23S rRNA (uracil(1939)-C(5))-methyltransferase RlmD [Gammaproteobacteria bacterium]MCF6361879.1 23S rRNA (uracil(1939)-C(5))-methyltransferase RlmD [Gammaproteobacteria bacterium]
MSNKCRKKLPEPRIATIDDMAHDGRGIAHIEGKAVFIHRALPGEEVLFRYCRTRGKFDEGDVLEVIRPSPQRVEPRCGHFGICGGCSLQHLGAEDQIAAKQQHLLGSLRKIGRVEPEIVLPPLTAGSWGYRRKARLGVKYMRRDQVVRVGFRERSSSFLANLKHCEVLHPRIGEHVDELSALVGRLSIKDQIPQIEVAVGDDSAALVFRHLADLNAADLGLLRDYGRERQLLIFLQSGGPKTIARLWPEGEESYVLGYCLPDYDVKMQFRPTDFTQVNAELNRKMIAQAIELLDPQPGERILDLFCGLGNFSLPLARRADHVVGVEGEAGLVARARENAVRNGIDNVAFHATDLNGDLSLEPWYGEGFDKLLLDPSRSGASVVVANLPEPLPKRIVYVSCDPATLARDAGTLVHEQGYRLVSAGVMDMFPQTGHIESIALFELSRQ